MLEKLTNQKFLIAEPHEQFRSILRQMLRNVGNRGQLTAENGKQAYDIMKSCQVDFIISNWHMPRMNGIELLKKIRTNPLYFNIPFLMISSERSAEKIICAMEDGVDGYIIKPFSEKYFLEQLKAIIQKTSNPTQIKRNTDEIRLFRIQKKYKQAIDLGSNLLKNVDDVNLSLLHSENLYIVREYEKAQQVLNNIIQNGDNNSKALHLYGKILMALEKYEDAVNYLKKAIAKNTFDLERKIDLAKANFTLGKINAAEEVINSILMQDVTELSLIEIANVYIDQGELQKARQCLSGVLSPISETIDIFSKYAIKLAKGDQNDEAIQVLKNCLKIEPKNDTVHFNLGFIYSKTEQYQEAVECFKKVLELNPNHLLVQVILDFAIKKSKQKKDCINYLQL